MGAGANWNPINNGLTNLYVQTLAIHPLDPSILYAGTNNLSINVWTSGKQKFGWLAAINLQETAPGRYSLVTINLMR